MISWKLSDFFMQSKKIKSSNPFLGLFARILKLMSFIKLVLCNESPRENKSSLCKMQILGNLAVKHLSPSNTCCEAEAIPQCMII